jgi:hypothetical protein
MPAPVTPVACQARLGAIMTNGNPGNPVPDAEPSPRLESRDPAHVRLTILPDDRRAEPLATFSGF